MPREIKPPRVMTLAGKDYTLRFSIDDRDSIETELDKGVWDAITSGRLRDQVVLIRHGLATKYPSLKDDAIRKRLQEHLDAGGDIDVPIRTVFWAVLEAGLCGGITNVDRLRKIIADPAMDPPRGEAEEGDQGKESPGAVRPADGF